MESREKVKQGVRGEEEYGRERERGKYNIREVRVNRE